MRLNAATYEGGRLILETADAEARRFIYDFKPGDYQLRRSGKKRSLDANAYAWVLMDKLAQATGYSKTEIYRNAVREIGGNTETLCMRTEAVARFRAAWEANGLGWPTEIMPSKLPGCTTVIAWYGSSTYDTRQMSALIDHLVQDCRALDIETLPPDKLAVLLEEWQ